MIALMTILTPTYEAVPLASEEDKISPTKVRYPYLGACCQHAFLLHTDNTTQSLSKTHLQYHRHPIATQT